MLEIQTYVKMEQLGKSIGSYQSLPIEMWLEVMLSLSTINKLHAMTAWHMTDYGLQNRIPFPSNQKGE